MALNRTLKHFLLALLTVALVACASTPEGGGSNKYRIKFNGKADTDGEVVFLVTPVTGEAKEVRLPVEEGTRENAAANDLEREMKSVLGGRDYGIERDDWEDVLVKKDLTSDNFRLELVSNTVDGLSVRVVKE